MSHLWYNVTMEFSRYNKKFDYSFTFGSYPTIELIKNRPTSVIKIITHSKLSGSNGFEIIHRLAGENKIKLNQNDRLIQKISIKDNCFVAGVFKKYTMSLDGQSNHIVLVNPKDSGNLGTIARSMLAFNFSDLAIITPAVDIFKPETIRASMGAIFSLNIQLFESFKKYKEFFPERNLYAFQTTGSENLSKIEFAKPASLVFGNESSGLEELEEGFKTRVKIPQSDKVDSLNLAVSVGIALNNIYSKGL